MTGEEFIAWMETLGLNDSSASRALGISRPSVVKYKADGAPLVVALACAAVARGIRAWTPFEHERIRELRGRLTGIATLVPLDGLTSAAIAEASKELGG